MGAANFPLRRLIKQPMFRRWVAANLMARLPLTMNLLVLVLAGEAVSGSVSTGATLAGAATFSAGVSARWRGRRLDRVELNRGMRADIALAAVLVSILGTAVLLTAPIWILFGLAVVMGWAYAAVLGGFRALLVEAVDRRDLEAANALDAVFVEVAFVTGPAIAALLATVMAPGVILLLMGVAFVAAIIVTAGLPERRPRAGRSPAGPAPFLTHGATPIYLLAAAMGLAIGSIEALVPARVETLGLSADGAGPFLALFAAGSGAAGVIAASYSNQLRRGRLYAAAMMVILGVAFWPLAETSSKLVFGVMIFFAGVPLAPLNALGSFALQRIVATERRAEGFSSYTAMILVGAGSGQLLVGGLLDRSSAEALLRLVLILPVAMAITLVAAAIRRRMIGLPPGLGADHDPSVPDPDSYAIESIERANSATDG